MRTKSIKELGTIELDRVATRHGQATIFIPVNVLNNEVEELLETLEKDFRLKHPETVEVSFDINVVYTFDAYTNAEFELEVIVWDERDEDVVEFYEEIKVNLSRKAMKVIKRIILDGLEKTFLEL